MQSDETRQISFEHFKALDIRVAEVLEAQDHPDADKLLVLRISLGEQERQIVAGIKEQYSPEDLVGRKIIVIANLEPATIRGEISQGMLLAARSERGAVILSPDGDVPAGAPVN